LIASLGARFLFENRIQLIKALLAENENKEAIKEIKVTKGYLSTCKATILNGWLTLLEIEALQNQNGLEKKQHLVTTLEETIQLVSKFPLCSDLLSRLHQVTGVILLGLKWNSIAVEDFSLGMAHLESSWKHHNCWRLSSNCKILGQVIQNKMYHTRLLCARILKIHKTATYEQLEALLESAYETAFDHDPSISGFLTSLDQFIFGCLCFQLRLARNDTLFLDYCQKVFHEHLQHLKKGMMQEYQRLRVVNAMLLTIEMEKGNNTVGLEILKTAVWTKLHHEILPLDKDVIATQDLPSVISFGLEMKSTLSLEEERMNLVSVDESMVLDKGKAPTVTSVTVNEIKEYQDSLEKELTNERIIWYCERIFNISYQQKKLRQFIQKNSSQNQTKECNSQTILAGWLYRPKEAPEISLSSEVMQFIARLGETVLDDDGNDKRTPTPKEMISYQSDRTIVIMSKSAETELQVAKRSIPKPTMYVIKTLIRSSIVSLRYHELTKDPIFLQEASQHWNDTLESISRILSLRNESSKVFISNIDSLTRIDSKKCSNLTKDI
jgi:HPt (histidine-containing phosphotransfer) domain-containing protein